MKTLSRLLVLTALFGLFVAVRPARAQEGEDPLKPKDRYRVGVCFDWEGGISSAGQKDLARTLLNILRREDAVSDVMELDYSLRTYGPWPGPGLDNDFICFTRITFAGRSNKFTIMMRFYYVRGDYNIILPDVTRTGYGRYKLRGLFAQVFRANFPVEALILRKSGQRIVLSRGSDAAIRRGDRFTTLSQTTKWWDVFGQPTFEALYVDENSCMVSIPRDTSVDDREQYIARTARLQPSQLMIRRNHDRGVYRADTNSYRIVWNDDRSPAHGARIMYALGRPDEVNEWQTGAQLLRQTVSLSLPAGVPVSVKAVLRRGEQVIEGKPAFIDRWAERTQTITLGLDPQYQQVNVKLLPEDVLPFVKVNGRGRKDRPLKLRWGTHSIEVVASAGGNWFPWREMVTVPVRNGILEVRLQRDYKEEIIDKIRAYYSQDKAAMARDEMFDEDVVDRNVLLIQAVSLMEQCPLNHPQFLSLRYTIASVLTREGYYPEALLTMLNYNAGSGLGGVGGSELRIVERGNWATNNVRLPRKWAWEWFIANPLSPLDRIGVDERLRLPVIALDSRLSAEDNGKIYNYLLGMLFYRYAHGAKTGQAYLPQTLDRCLAYLIALNYLSQTNYPTLPQEPFLNLTLNFYSKYYIFRLLDEISPLITDLSQRAAEVRREYERLRKSTKGDVTATEEQRLKRQQARLLLQMNLIDYHSKLTKRHRAIAAEFLRYCDRLRKQEDYRNIDEKTRRSLELKRKEVADKLATVGGEVIEEAG